MSCSPAVVMEPESPLDQVLARWKMRNPDVTWPRITPGYRICREPGCPTRIEETQSRLVCYFHGGQPTPRRRSTYTVTELARIHANSMRRRRE